MARLLRLVLIISIAFWEPAFAVGTVGALEPHVTEEELPMWLRRLNLNPAQIHRVIVIDELFHQRLIGILTASQYARWQAFVSSNGTAQGSIHDADLGLSPYQQALLDAAYQEAMTSLVNILSQEQQQLLFYDLEK